MNNLEEIRDIWIQQLIRSIQKWQKKLRMYFFSNEKKKREELRESLVLNLSHGEQPSYEKSLYKSLTMTILMSQVRTLNRWYLVHIHVAAKGSTSRRTKPRNNIQNSIRKTSLSENNMNINYQSIIRVKSRTYYFKKKWSKLENHSFTELCLWINWGDMSGSNERI